MGYNSEMMCRSANMELEDINREREMSGWNQYVGEEEEPEGDSGRAQEMWMAENESDQRQKSGETGRSTESQMENSRMKFDRAADRQSSAWALNNPNMEKTDVETRAEQPDAEMMWQIENQRKRERDLRHLQAMYPETARILLPHVEEACDELEYEGSMMYDERPDYETVLRIRDKILENVKDEFEPMEPPPRDEMLTMQYRPGPPRRRRGNWLGDFAQTMLLEEMHRRRCRSCRRW